MTQTLQPNIVCVVISYEPDLKILRQLLEVIRPQVSCIVVVDNGSKIIPSFRNTSFESYEAEVISLGQNIGIAAAHNIGIQWAQNNRAEFVLLMDQDSIPAPNMVQILLSSLLKASRMDSIPIAAGPVCVDTRTGRKSFFMIERKGRPARWVPAANASLGDFSLDVSFLISSGTLIDLNSLQSVGGMRSNYFIDHVDTEWCFRAKAQGYSLLGVPKAQMHHTLGDTVRNVWFFGWRQVAYHSPLRDYYMFRNTLLMLRDVQMSFAWRMHFLWRLVQFLGYFLIFTPQRRRRLYCMALGISHGLRGIDGKLDLKKSKCAPVSVSDLDP